MPKFLGKITIFIFFALIVGSFWYWQETSKAQEELPIFVKEEPLEKIERPLYVPDEIIVKFKTGIPDQSIKDFHQKQGTQEIYESPFARFKVLKIPAGKTVPEMVEIYKKNPQVEYAEPNSIAYAFMVPTDLHYPWQWHFDDDHTINPGGGSSNPYGGANGGGIRMEPAWDIDTTPPLYGGDPVIKVAVLDTGIAYEKYQAFRRSPDFQAPYPAFTAGYDFINNDSHPNDDEGHGTHVAGTIAGSTNNSNGHVAGIAFNITLMPVKVLDNRGEGTAKSVADGIYYATNNEAKVINMSLGWPPGYDPGTTVYNAIKYAYDHGVVQVAATGNENVSTISYPAKYSEVIAVGATRYDETRTYYSNYGEGIDLVAPGGDINVDQNGDGYGDGVCQITFIGGYSSWYYVWMSGTSMSTPHVSGVAALLLAYKPSLTPSEVRNILQSTAEDKGASGWDQYYGWGLVDAYAALLSIVPPVSITLTTDGTTPFEILALGATKDTTPSGTNDVQTVQVTTGPANLDVKSTVFRDNGNLWSLGTTNGANQVKWEFSPNTIPSWQPFLAPNTLYDLANNVAQGSTQDVYFRLTMPTSTSSHNPHSAQVTIVATAP